ncbi:MAG TPA: hypothetical protein VJ184_06730, partial [Chryseolinea sp.]|nr:hypothetical protein [Chryseolinea sp.]
LVTTMMTGPALDLINFLFKEKIEVIPYDIIEASKYKVLISFGNPQTGRSLVRLASNLTKNLNGNALLTAMHLSPTNELHHYNIDQYERESFEPVLQESKNIKQKVTTLFKASNDIESDISEITNKGGFDLLLIGVGQSIFQGSLLGKILGFTTGIINPEKILNKVTGKEKLFDNSPFDARTQLILSSTNTQVGIYVDRNLDQPDQIFIPVLDKSDAYLLEFAQRFINNSKSQVVILDMKGAIKASPELKEHIRMIEQTAPNHIAISREGTPSKEFLKTQKLMLISLNAWKYLIDSKSEWLSDIPSALIITRSNSSQS